MADQVEGDPLLQGLTCPFCLDILSNATLLSCGHTFCKTCLESYDESQRHMESMVCPVCKASTELRANRVAELSPNYLAREIENNLHLVTESVHFNFCSEHEKVYNDIYCEVCQKFICLNCFLSGHQGHAIKKKEELEGDYIAKETALFHQSDDRKVEIEKLIQSTEQQRQDIHSHFSGLEMKVKDEVAKKMSILQQHEKSLLDIIGRHRLWSNTLLDNWISHQKQLVDSINSSASAIRQKTNRFVDVNTFKAHDLLCNNLTTVLEEAIDPVHDVYHTVVNITFRPADSMLLALGDIDPSEDTITSGKAHFHSQDGGNNLSDHACLGAEASTIVRHGTSILNEEINRTEAQTSVQVAPMSASVRTFALSIVKKVDLPGYMRGMAALSHDAVVVGYGINRNGADRFSISGDKRTHLKSKVGQVWDITFLSDGRSVVSQGTRACKVYDMNTAYTGIQYTCEAGKNCLSLCSDQSDNIYAIDDNSEIHIFHGTSSNPQRVVPTGSIKPEHICITKAGVIIISTGCITPMRVIVYNSDGQVGGSISAGDSQEYMYAAIDSLDRVLIAMVRERSTVFKLALYKVLGLRLIEEKAFAPIKLPRHIKGKWCYMVSLTPNMLAFATLDHHLYFIELLM